jgi:hypothetical protein
VTTLGKQHNETEFWINEQLLAKSCTEDGYGTIQFQEVK